MRDFEQLIDSVEPYLRHGTEEFNEEARQAVRGALRLAYLDGQLALTVERRKDIEQRRRDDRRTA